MLRLLSYFTCVGWIVSLVLYFTGTLSIWPFVGLLAVTVGLNVVANIFTTTPSQQAAENFFNSLSQDARDELNSGRPIMIDTRSDSERKRNPIGDQT